MVEANNSFTILTVKNKLETLTHKFKHLFTSMHHKVSQTIHVDGLQLFRSSPDSMWPILCKFNNHVFTKFFPIALFVGIGKPIVKELEEFKNNYISIDGIF